MGLVRRIVRRVVRVATGAVKGVLNFASKAISTVTKGFTDLVGGVMQGITSGSLFKGFARAFLGSPFGLMAASTLGAFGAMLGFCGTQRALAEASRHACHSRAYEHPCARQNMAHMMAYHQARIMAANGWYC